MPLQRDYWGEAELAGNKQITEMAWCAENRTADGMDRTGGLKTHQHGESAHAESLGVGWALSRDRLEATWQWWPGL